MTAILGNFPAISTISIDGHFIFYAGAASAQAQEVENQMAIENS